MRLNAKYNLDASIVQKVALKYSQKSAKEIAYNTLKEAVATAPYDTGELAKSHYVRVDGKRYEVGNTAPHALYVHALPQTSIQGGKSSQWLQKALTNALREANVRGGKTRGNIL